MITIKWFNPDKPMKIVFISGLFICYSLRGDYKTVYYDKPLGKHVFLSNYYSIS